MARVLPTEPEAARLPDGAWHHSFTAVLNSMRIALDATCWSNGRGYGRFAREQASALVRGRPDDTFVCVGDRTAFEAFTLSGPNVELLEVPLTMAPTEAAAAEGYRSPIDMLRLGQGVRRARARVFLSPTVYTWFPLMPGQRAIVTIHDAIVERFPHLTIPSARSRVFWNLKVRSAIWQSRLVLTTSAYGARDLELVMGIPRSKIRLCGAAPPPDYRPSNAEEIAGIREKYGLGDAPYFVYVGGFNPHKRVDTLIAAHAQLSKSFPERPPLLVLVGRITGDVFHGETERLLELSRSSGATDHVRWVGFVPDAELRHLHSGATAVTLVSEVEGYGLPAVEGAACGAPVIATRESPLPEVLADGGIFVRPGDVDGIAEAMRALLRDPDLRSGLAATALRRASSLSWEAVATATWQAIVEAAA